jgi:hypothetical protein
MAKLPCSGKAALLVPSAMHGQAALLWQSCFAGANFGFSKYNKICMIVY